MPTDLLTYRELAERLQMKRSSLYSLVCRGKIPHIRLSRRSVRFDADEIAAWLEARRVPLAKND